MKRLLFFVLLITLTNSLANIKSGIEKILRESPQKIHFGMVVRKASSGKILYQTHRNFLYAPASTQKLLTATAALSLLGPNFTYKTKLLTNGKISGKNLQGDLIFRFSGDPELTSDDLQELIEKLKNLGVTKILGTLKFDTSSYDDVFYPPGWLWDDLSYSYAAPLTTAILDKNKFILRLTPATKLGAPPELSVDIPNKIIKFDNRVKTTATYNKNCPLTIYSDIHNNFTLQGCLNKNWGRRRRNLAIRNPLPYIRAVIFQSLADNNIALLNKTHPHKAHLTLLATHHSVPLRKLLKDMLKKSDNLITDSLLKQLGHRYYHTQGTWQNGVNAMEKILEPTKIDFKQNLVNDGAGLSRYDLLTPNQMSLLLEYIYHKRNLRPIILEALPIAGIDGTLVERMFSEAKQKRIRAKTGTMTGITGLAGFIYSRHLGVLSFSIFINGFVGKSHPFTRLEDKLVEYLAHTKG